MTDDTYFSHSEAWLDQLSKTAWSGRAVAPRGMATVERSFVQFRVRDPMTFPLRVDGREFRDAIGLMEALSMVGQFSVTEMFTDRVRKFHDFTDDGVFHGSYGARLHGQVGDLVALMKRDPDTRQGVLTIFDATRDLDRAKRDIPCTLNLHFLQRDVRWGPDPEDVARRLDLRTTMRSNDLWLGTPYDIVQFSILQATVAQALGIRVGEYVHSAGSLHLYERDRAKTTELMFVGGPAMPFPLWTVSDLATITERARRLALYPHEFEPQTQFEHWAQEVLTR